MSTYVIHINNAIGANSLPIDRLIMAITWVLDHHGAVHGAGLTLVVTDDEQVRALNRAHRGVDAPTDILSFPAAPLPDDLRTTIAESDDDMHVDDNTLDLPEIDTADDDDAQDELYLGDLIVAYPYSVAHAQIAGHTIDDELTLLAIHGTLHLLGFDHDSADHQAAMWAAQADALAAAGVGIVVEQYSFDDVVEDNQHEQPAP